jgi:hypothetical protein
MLSYGADFWPLFWTVIGSAAALTALLCLAVATYKPSWFRRHQRATIHHLPAARVGQERKAA